MAAKEKGRAGQEWPPCPNTVTSSAAANSFGVRSRRRFHRAGSQRSSPGAALRLVSGSRVATVMPAGTSSGPSSRSMENEASVKRAIMERCAIRVDSSAQVSARPVSPRRTPSASSGCSMRSTRCQPSAANRLDMDATWMRVMSREIPVAASSASASAQASTTRSKSMYPEAPSLSCSLARRSSSPSPSCAVTSASAARSSALSVAATWAMAPGCTKDSEPSSWSNDRISVSKRSPSAAPGPPQEASPTR